MLHFWAVAQPAQNFLGPKCLTLGGEQYFCLGRRFLQHKITRLATNLWDVWPAYAFVFRSQWSRYLLVRQTPQCEQRHGWCRTTWCSERNQQIPRLRACRKDQWQTGLRDRKFCGGVGFPATLRQSNRIIFLHHAPRLEIPFEIVHFRLKPMT